MAASTSTSVGVYDVFINHRGPDVKKNLASHLYYRLFSHGLRAFLDQQELNEGENFESEIKGAIASASVHVAIFSPGYAESKWCLDELQLMLDSGFPVIPVFYKVKPAVLRWTHEQDKGVYARDLDNHEKKKAADGHPRYNSTTVDNWRNALYRAAQITGFELDAFNGDEGKLLDEVVKCVLKRVKKTQLKVAKYAIGLEEKAQDFERTVISQQHSGRAQVVGIVGLGGVGKTTLAKELFNRKSSNYSKSYFLSDVRENKRSLHSLQRKVLSGLLQSDKISIDNVHEGIEMLEKHLSTLQFLLVLDDVDNVDQVDALLPVNVLCPDSLILITSRHKDVLRRSGIKESTIYELTGLDKHHSRVLFCSYAFCQPHPPSGFESLVNRFLEACQGLPLSLKVFGGLVSVNNDKSDWEDQLTKLQQTLPEEIQKRLQISYDALDGEEKQIFLDIACFFIGEERDMAIKIWNGSGWTGSLGFRTLLNKCLVELDMEDKIRMHDHLRDLGRGIVAKHSESPRRLWRGIEDIDDLKHYSSGKRSVRGIRVFVSENVYDDQFFHQIIRNEDEEDGHNDEDDEDEDDDSSQQSRKLRKLLQLNEVKVANLQLLDVDFLSEQFLSGVYSPNLIWLRWYQCHLSSLPSWIPMEKLHVLEVHGKELQTLWQPKSKVPFNLRELRIFAPLSTIPKSIGKLKHLERIVVSNPFSFEKGYELAFLEELPKEFGCLRSLKALELTWFPKMRSLPDSLGNLTNLEHIDLSGCSGLEMLPNTFSNLTMLKYLDLSHCNKLTISGETLGNIRTLKHIDLRGCDNIDVLPSQVAHQRFLEKLYLGLMNLKESPSDFGELSTLEDLEIQSSLLETLPPSIGGLSNLKHLQLRCPKLKCLRGFENLRSLEYLNIVTAKLKSIQGSAEHTKLRVVSVVGCSDLEELPGFETLRSLENLLVSTCAKLKSIRGSAEHTKLRSIIVYNCSDLEELPGFENLRSLEYLYVSRCAKLKSIRGSAEHTKLRSISVYNCSDLEELPGFETLSSLKSFHVSGCVKLKSTPGLAQLTELRSLNVSACSDLEELPGVENLRSLKLLDVSGCVKLNSIPGLAQWTELNVSGLSNLEDLPGIENLRSLELLDVSGCVKLNSIPGLAQWTELQALNISGRSDLEELPGVENLRSLKYLDVSGCVKLKSIPGLAQLTDLRVLKVSGCSGLEELPGVEHLRYVYIFAEECPKLHPVKGVVEQLKKRVTYIWGSNIQPVDIPVSNIYLSSSEHDPWIVESIVGEGVVEQFKQRGTRIDPVDISVSSHPQSWVLKSWVHSLDRLDSLDGHMVIMYVSKEEKP